MYRSTRLESAVFRVARILDDQFDDQLRLGPVVIVAATSGVTEVVSYVDQFGTGTLAGLVLVNGIAGRDYDQETTSNLLAYANSFQTDRERAADRFVRALFKKPKSEDYIRRMVEATLRMPTNSAMALIFAPCPRSRRMGHCEG